MESRYKISVSAPRGGCVCNDHHPKTPRLGDTRYASFLLSLFTTLTCRLLGYALALVMVACLIANNAPDKTRPIKVG